MKWLALIAILGCTRSSEVKTDAKTELRAEENVTQTVQTGPSETTIYKFAPPETSAPSEPSSARDRPCHDPLGSRSPRAADSSQTVPAERGFSGGAQLSLVGSEGAVDFLPSHGPLVEMDVIRTEGSLSTTVAAATTTVATDSHSDATKASSVGLNWKFYAAGVLVVLLLAGAAYVLWRAKMFTI